MEVWESVVGWESYYQVSDQGRVRSLNREIECKGKGGSFVKKKIKGRIPKPRKDKSNRLRISISLEGATIAAMYRVTREAISRIKVGKNWGWL